MTTAAGTGTTRRVPGSGAARTIRVDLTENGPEQEVVIPHASGIALGATGLVDARPVPRTGDAEAGAWVLRPTSRVGAVAVPGLEVHVAPKVPIERVMFLLEHSRRGVAWAPETVHVAQAPDLLRAIVETFERVTTRALATGLRQGYRTVEDTLPMVRGRIREADQLRRHHGLALPVEVRYDDFTVDTPENRLLRAAVLLARRLPSLGHSPGPGNDQDLGRDRRHGPDQDLGHRLRRLDARLADVTPLTPRHGLEPWHPTRLNAHLHHALHLAEVITRHCSFDLGQGRLVVTGFALNLATVFEDFLCTQLANRLNGRGGDGRDGTVRLQYRCHLDHDRQVAMRPDLVWLGPGRSETGHGGFEARAVVDAKYKAERPGGFPDADLYQMLAYCTALRLPVGHLVYARGNEPRRSHRVAGTDVTIHAHALDLDQPPTGLLADLDALAGTIADAAQNQRAEPAD